MSPTLDVSIVVLVWILVLFFIAMGVMLTLCLIELLKTLKNCVEISKVLKDDAQPLIGELKNTLANVQKITSGTKSNLGILKSALTGALGAGALMLGNLKSKKGGFISGLISGFNLFRK